MKLSSKILAIAITAAATCSLIGCGAPSGFSYQNVSIAITASCYDCTTPVTYNPAQPGVLNMTNSSEGSTIILSANVTNAPQQVTWQIYPLPNLTEIGTLPTGTATPVGESTDSVGTIDTQSGNIAYYTNSGSVPVYSGAALQQAQTMQYTISYTTTTVVNGVSTVTTVNQPAVGIPQGDVLLAASTPNNPTNPSQTFTAYLLIQIYNSTGTPSVYLSPKTPTTPSLTDSVAFVAHNGGTFQFYGGAVGAGLCVTSTGCVSNGTQVPLYGTDNAALWEVGTSTATAVIGGNSTVGTISSTGLYTAPATIPASGAQVVVLVAAHALPTITAVAYLTIQ
jgi:hypothetical protein